MTRENFNSGSASSIDPMREAVKKWTGEVEMSPVYYVRTPRQAHLREQMLAIEESVFEYAWTEQEFEGYLREPGFSAEVITLPNTDKVVGYIVRRSEIILNRKVCYIENLAIAPGFQGQGLGLWILAQLMNKLVQLGYEEIRATPRETNLPVQKLLSKAGFRALGLSEAPWESYAEDGPAGEKVIKFKRKLPRRHN